MLAWAIYHSLLISPLKIDMNASNLIRTVTFCSLFNSCRHWTALLLIPLQEYSLLFGAFWRFILLKIVIESFLSLSLSRFTSFFHIALLSSLTDSLTLEEPFSWFVHYTVILSFPQFSPRTSRFVILFPPLCSSLFHCFSLHFIVVYLLFLFLAQESFKNPSPSLSPLSPSILFRCFQMQR